VHLPLHLYGCWALNALPYSSIVMRTAASRRPQKNGKAHRGSNADLLGPHVCGQPEQRQNEEFRVATCSPFYIIPDGARLHNYVRCHVIGGQHPYISTS